jgi:hypothetical protein
MLPLPEYGLPNYPPLTSQQPLGDYPAQIVALELRRSNIFPLDIPRLNHLKPVEAPIQRAKPGPVSSRLELVPREVKATASRASPSANPPNTFSTFGGSAQVGTSRELDL